MKTNNSRSMADWKHKEAIWVNQSYPDRYPNQRKDGDPSKQPKEKGIRWISVDGPFHEWLNKQCKGGWEVVKIARDFSTRAQSTWCVFRRKSE